MTSADMTQGANSPGWDNAIAPLIEFIQERLELVDESPSLLAPPKTV